MAILIHTISSEEKSLVENLLTKMKISFEHIKEDEKIVVSEDEMKSIKRGIEQAKNGEFSSSEEVHNRAKTLCSK